MLPCVNKFHFKDLEGGLDAKLGLPELDLTVALCREAHVQAGSQSHRACFDKRRSALSRGTRSNGGIGRTGAALPEGEGGART